MRLSIIKNVLLLVLLLLITAAFNSCNKNCSEEKLKSLMGSWYKKKILFPSEMEVINNSAIDPARLNHPDPKEQSFSIIHFFMADCDKCVNELLSIQKFIQKHKSSANVKYVFIAAGPTKIYARDAVLNSGFALPVYYEKEYFSFKKLNHLPLADNLYNTMLLDNKNEVMLFGELFQNDMAEKLFYNTINSCNECLKEKK
jgi:hypothetical protein